jgi:F0F1-type ATP synthase assembly protein I
MNRHDLNNYGKYSSIGFQMIAIMVAGVFGGIYLDKWLHSKPIFTIVLSLISVALSMYYTIKDVSKTK